MSRSCQNGHQQPCNITVIVVVNSKVHCRWNKDPLLQFYRQLHISSHNKEQTYLCQFDQCVSSVIQIWQHLPLASAHVLLSTLTVPVNRGTHSPIRTHTPVIYSPNYYVPEFFFSPRAWTFQCVLSTKPSELPTFSLRSLPSRAALKTTFLNSRPVAAILNSSPPPQTLKSPSLRSKLR